jgi:hypothetical protein
MIRFVDLRAAYYCGMQASPGQDCGPFAFIDTVSDAFVTVGGWCLFFSYDDLIAHALTEAPVHREAKLDRLISLMPRDYPGVPSGQVEAAIARRRT